MKQNELNESNKRTSTRVDVITSGVDGCSQCKWFESQLDFNADRVEGEPFAMIRKCKQGHVDRMNKWWNDHGHVKRVNGEPLPSMILPCHQYHESTISLMRMNALTSSLLNQIKNSGNLEGS